MTENIMFQPAKARRPRPFLNEKGDLIIPTDVSKRYRYWDEKVKDRMSIADILVDLSAPLDVLGRYLVPNEVTPAANRIVEARVGNSITADMAAIEIDGQEFSDAA